MFKNSITTLLLLGGCGSGPTMEEVAPSLEGQTEQVFFLTTRVPVDGTDLFSDARASEPTYGVVDVGIPPVHQLGRLEITDGTPDPAQHFHNAGTEVYAGSDLFTHAVVENGEPVIVFVHGFNNTFAESTYRFAQIVHDIGREVTPVSLAWASRGTANGYAYDRNSALMARDELADLIVQLSTKSSQDVILVAHSLGSLVVLEALLQLSLQNDRKAIDGIGQILLISPDLDADLFADQMQRINFPPSQMAIAVNNNDRMLAISGRIAGTQKRVGRDLDSRVLTDAGFRVLDLSEVNDGDMAGHFLLATSPTTLGFVRSLQNRQSLGQF